MVIRCRSWNSGCRGNVWRLLGIGGTFEGVSYTLIVFEFLGAVEVEFLASTKAYSMKREGPYLTLPTNSLLAAMKSFSVTITAMSSSVAR